MNPSTTPPDAWLQMRVRVPHDAAGFCLELLFDCGAQGAQVDDTEVLLDNSEDATFAARAFAVVTGYLPGEAAPNEIAEELTSQLAAAGIEAQIEWELLARQDWESSWKENFPPLRIGPFLIVPPWEKEGVAEQGETIIRLDPGLAFGTGQHPTTRMCLELLAQELGGKPHSRVLDVGCGSGILGIAAAKLGARVTGSDPDPFCIEATRANAAANGVQIAVTQAAGLGWVSEPFDMAVANLMSNLLIDLAPQLACAVRAGGTLVVSGISEPRAAEVEAALTAAGFRGVMRRDMQGEARGDFVEEWTAFVLLRLTPEAR